MRKKIRTPTFRMGNPTIPLEKALYLAGQLEDEELLQRMIAAGDAHPPLHRGMPKVIEDLAPEVASLLDLIIAERRKERSKSSGAPLLGSRA